MKHLEFEILVQLENATTKIAQYVYKWLKKYIKRKYGYNYLYDVIPKAQ